MITCHGGGFIASGAVGIDKAPVVHYPAGLTILNDEGFGEVQTPMKMDKRTVSETSLKIGDAVWCRHAKAGELCEHFNELVCYEGAGQMPQGTAERAINHTSIRRKDAAATMTTYRGDGRCFH